MLVLLNITTNTSIKNGKQVNKNTTTNTTGMIIIVNKYVNKDEEHSSDCLLCHVKGNAKQTT